MDRQTIDPLAIGVLLVLCASWGVQQVSIKVASQGISPILQAGIRSTGATVLLLIWMALTREPLLENDGTLRWGIAAGLLFTGEFFFIYWGLNFTLASRAIVFLYLTPFIVAIGAQLFLPGEHLTRIQIVGLCCAFAGILSVFSESLVLPTRRMLIGDCMLMAAAVFWGSTTVLVKASPLARLRPGKVLLYQLAVSALALLLAAWLRGEPGIIAMTPLIAVNMGYQTIWVAFITYLAWFWLVRRYPPSRLAAFTFFTPLFGVAAGGLILGEPLSIRLLTAVVLVGCGIYLVNRPA